MRRHARIEIDPEVMLGKPVFRGTRITVELVLRELADGASEDALLEMYPRLTRRDVQAVLSIREQYPGMASEDIMDLAGRGGPIVVTEDRAFGQIFRSTGFRGASVVCLRFPAAARRCMVDAVLALIQEQGDRLVGSFVVLQPGRIRIVGRPEG